MCTTVSTFSESPGCRRARAPSDSPPHSCPLPSCLARRRGGRLTGTSNAMNTPEQWKGSHAHAVPLAAAKLGCTGLPRMMMGCREGPRTSSSRAASPTHRAVLLCDVHGAMLEPLESFPLFLKPQLHATTTCDLALSSSSGVLTHTLVSAWKALTSCSSHVCLLLTLQLSA